jgi:hypothetical protein
VARPRKVARRSGIPKRVSVIRSAASVRALRTSRSSHDKRSCARLCPRDRRRGRSRGSLESWLHLDREVLAMQTQAGVPLVPSVPVSPEERSRAYRQGMKQDAHLARFGRGTPTPLALVAASGHGRQSRMLAQETIRRLPSCSRRCSCGTKTLPAGQRKVPSGWRRKSAPVKRPAFRGGSRWQAEHTPRQVQRE